MPAYHQMGHHTENLLLLPELQGFDGAILSPVNYDEASMIEQIRKYREIGNGEVIFDPQLYYPRTVVPNIREWSYFPSDFESANAYSDPWWTAVVNNLVATVTRIGADAICSPAIVPRAYSDEYFASIVGVGNSLVSTTGLGTTAVLQTVLVGLADLANLDRVYSVASIVSETRASRIYLVFESDVDPRREIADADALTGAMLLISTLESSGLRVLVGFSATDVLLWKSAGATACATSKFWNLRRFTPSRWDPEDGGGGQLGYWIEESLVASLREADVLRVRQAGMISFVSLANLFAPAILSRIEAGEPPWVGLGWRQYLYWFADVESRLANGSLDAALLLREAEENWEKLDDLGVLMDEPRNDGRWLRPWRQALNGFRQLP